MSTPIKLLAKNGFTLIEILVVMAIIGILASLSIISFQSSQTKSRDAQRKSDLKQIANSLEAYINDKGQYPVHTLDNGIRGCEDSGSGATDCAWGEEWSDENDTIYMVALPTDPKSFLNYYYESDGSYYQLYARLENSEDAAVPLVGEAPGNYGISCGSAGCNYGVASSNITVGSGRVVVAD